MYMPRSTFLRLRSRWTHVLAAWFSTAARTIGFFNCSRAQALATLLRCRTFRFRTECRCLSLVFRDVLHFLATKSPTGEIFLVSFPCIVIVCIVAEMEACAMLCFVKFASFFCLLTQFVVFSIDRFQPMVADVVGGRLFATGDSTILESFLCAFVPADEVHRFESSSSSCQSVPSPWPVPPSAKRPLKSVLSSKPRFSPPPVPLSVSAAFPEDSSRAPSSSSSSASRGDHPTISARAPSRSTTLPPSPSSFPSPSPFPSPFRSPPSSRHPSSSAASHNAVPARIGTSAYTTPDTVPDSSAPPPSASHAQPSSELLPLPAAPLGSERVRATEKPAAAQSLSTADGRKRVSTSVNVEGHSSSVPAKVRKVGQSLHKNVAVRTDRSHVQRSFFVHYFAALEDRFVHVGLFLFSLSLSLSLCLSLCVGVCLWCTCG